MSNPKISVLVPVYNAADYIKQCLESLKGQSMDDLEFILINDGSTDNSLAIMNEYKKEDKRFIILDKKNTGYGDSLNCGMKLVRGEYIGIVEPDDYCDKKMFQTLFELAVKEDADIVRGNYYHHSETQNDKRQSIFAKYNKRVINPKKDFEVFFEPPAIWSAIYKRAFLKQNRILFLDTPGASYQDTGFYLKTLACAKKVAFVDKPLYYYRIDNPGSSVKNKKKINAVVKEYKSVEDFLKKVEDGDLFIKYCQVAKFGSYNWNLLRLSKKGKWAFIKKMKEELLLEKERGNLERKYFPKRYWFALNILLDCPERIYYCMINLKQMMNVNQYIANLRPENNNLKKGAE